jgi:8-oxo-dGTP pyrophosphatase MutT (NUDIX family)
MISIATLHKAVHLPDFDPVPAQLKMAPLRARIPAEGVTPRQAGVLVLVYPEQGDLHVILTRRTDSLSSHSGQISFPGGKHNAEDESFTITALRETCEELGICNGAIQVIGMLSRLYIPPSNFEVYPTVGLLEEPPLLAPNPHEVAEVFTLPLHQLLDSSLKRSEEWDFNGTKVTIPFYAIQGHKVWGATAIMLSELEHRLLAVLQEDTQKGVPT